MGIDCNIYLPGNVRIKDVAHVVGILLGCEVTRNGRFLRVPDVKVVPAIPEMSTIETANRSPCFHYEPGRAHVGRRLVKFGTDHDSVRVAHALVDFFGGYADFNDCDDTERDYEQPDRTDAENCPEDGAEWDALQARVWALYESRKKASE